MNSKNCLKNPGKGGNPALRRANLISIVVLLIATLQLAGFLVHSKILRGLGAASAASPFPKVFCAAPVYGEPGVKLETFSSRFTLVYRLDGRQEELQITPEIYSRLRGPYNRRNVYGAALAYGPCLPPGLVHQTLNYALREPGRLIAELELPSTASDFKIRITGMANGREREWLVAPRKKGGPS